MELLAISNGWNIPVKIQCKSIGMVSTYIEHPWTVAFDISNIDPCRTPQMCSSLHNKLITFQPRSNMLRSVFACNGIKNVVLLRCFGGLHSVCLYTNLSATPILDCNAQQQHFLKRLTGKGTKWAGYNAAVAPADFSTNVDLHEHDVRIPMVVLVLLLVVCKSIAFEIWAASHHLCHIYGTGLKGHVFVAVCIPAKSLRLREETSEFWPFLPTVWVTGKFPGNSVVPRFYSLKEFKSA